MCEACNHRPSRLDQMNLAIDMRPELIPCDKYPWWDLTIHELTEFALINESFMQGRPLYDDNTIAPIGTQFWNSAQDPELQEIAALQLISLQAELRRRELS